MGMWFGDVKPLEDIEDRITKEVCQIDSVTNTSYSCYRKNRVACRCSESSSCLVFTNSTQNGRCCDGKCCTRKVCQSCYRSRRRCHGTGKSRRCSTRLVYYPCCSKRCVDYAEETYSIEWGVCWNVNVAYHIVEEENERSLAEKCGWNDGKCVERIYQTFSSDYKDCWLDPKHDSVGWKAPSGVPTHKFVGFWFGISFCIIGTLIFIGIIINKYVRFGNGRFAMRTTSVQFVNEGGE